MNWSVTAIWIAITIVMGVIEAITIQLVTIWFALGALAALIVSLLHGPFALQCIVFLVVSLLSLLGTRPLVRKYLKPLRTPTNADRVVGQNATVLTEIDSSAGQGTVQVNGAVWSAKTEDEIKIPAGASVTVQRIEGVKLVVIPK